MKISKHLIFLNLSVFLISTSGIFGRLITLTPEITIFYRCLIASLLLYSFIKYRKLSFKLINPSHWKYIALGGVLMAVHWVSYFYALSLSSIAIAMITLHSFPAMTSILEPIILKTPFKIYHLLLALLVILGICIILPSTDTSDVIVISTFCGLISALSYALRNIWTRKIMMHYNASVIMYFHLIIMSVLLCPFMFFQDSSALETDWIYVLALAVFTTVIGHTLLVNALRHFSAVSVGLISSVIPLYGILWGLIFLSEVPNVNTILGGSLIMASFVIESYSSQREIKSKNAQKN